MSKDTGLLYTYQTFQGHTVYCATRQRRSHAKSWITSHRPIWLQFHC